MANAPAPLSPTGEIDYIRKRATELGLDPEAVLAVAAHEGLSVPSAVGDSGTSFGPWQLHAGGKLPPQIFSQGSIYAQQWANSTGGIDYALEGIAQVARGKQGPDAITSIVNSFEQPRADLRAGEIAASISTYNQGGVPGFTGSSSGLYNPGTGAPLNPPPAGSLGIGTAEGTPGAAGFWDIINSTKKLIEFVTSWRFAEIVGGILLLIIGLFLVGRALGMSVPVGPLASPAGSAADAAPGPIAAQPRRVQKRAGFTLPADQKPRRVKNEAAMSDEIPF